MIAKGRGDMQLHPEKHRGERNHNAKLTALQVKEMRQLFAAGGRSKKSLARQFGITDTMACFVINKKNWRSDE